MRIASSLLVATAVLFVSGPVSAETVCMTIDEFNAFMASSGLRTPTATLSFDVTNVDPNDYAGTKGAVAQLDDSSCRLGAGFVTKLYGPDDPPNLMHPPGTLKQEFNDGCCAEPSCPEGWADPNPSEPIFVDPAQQCEVTVWIDPAEHGYGIDCDGVVWDAVGPNLYGVQIDRASILVGTDGSLWPMPNAVSTWNEICFEEPLPPEPDPGGGTLDVPVIEDVTASIGYPDTVYPLLEDLSCGADDSEFFLKFDLSGVPGTIQSAQLHLRSLPGSSADGDGGDVFLVADNGWSEATLTWNGRPGTVGTSLDRLGPVALDTAYVLDVSAAITDATVYSLAVVPQPTDGNGVHFHSKEGSAAYAPFLRVEYQDGGPTDSSGSGEGGSDGDGSGATGPEGGSDTGGGTAGGGALTGFGGPRSPDVGCACSSGGRRRSTGWTALVVLALLGLRRRRCAAGSQP